MNYYIGADLGTSALKLLLVSEKGEVVNTVTNSYEVSYPGPGWSEQSPEGWWTAFEEGVKELIKGTDPAAIRGIGAGGQMHGLVILDSEDKVIRPAILWNDGRTDKETEYLNSVIGKDSLSEMTANIAFAGFTAPKILWVKKNEKENFDRISKIMLPKDYLNYLLTGVHMTDYSDASGMLLLDVKNKCWSKEMTDICGISEKQLPELKESYEAVKILPDMAKKLGLSEDCLVVAGAGDNAAAAIGTGTVGNGKCNISLGTSGTVFISSDKFSVDSNNALHSFCHADGGYHLMGCMLSAASCNKWFCDEILKTDDYAAEQTDITDEKLGNNHVYFLPYLMGERSPINDTDARGMFIGMRPDTSRSDMILAILEGVAFAIRDSIEVAKSLGIRIDASTICGGGGKSPLWRRIMCNVLDIDINIPVCEEGPGMGGAMLAMVADGAYKSVNDCAENLFKIKDTVHPDREISQRYAKQYEKFRKIYPAVMQLYKDLKQED